MQGETPVEQPLRCICLDDSALFRKVQKRLIKNFLRADMDGSAVLGETAADIDVFVEIALGRVDPVTRAPVTHRPLAHADLVVIDQDLDYDTLSYKGTDIARRLNDEQFRGVCCLLTGANLSGDQGQLDEGKDIGTVRLDKCPGVDIAFEKGSLLKDIAVSLRKFIADNKSSSG